MRPTFAPAGSPPPQLHRGRAAFVLFPEGGADPALGEIPRAAEPLPRRGVHRVRVGRIDHEIDEAGPRIGAREDLIPARARVVRAEDAARAAFGVELAERGDADVIAVLRVDHDPRDAI